MRDVFANNNKERKRLRLLRCPLLRHNITKDHIETHPKDLSPDTSGHYRCMC